MIPYFLKLFITFISFFKNYFLLPTYLLLVPHDCFTCIWCIILFNCFNCIICIQMEVLSEINVINIIIIYKLNMN